MGAGADAMARAAPPGTIEGFVTSSDETPNVGRPVALAMLQRGRSRLGERITVHHLGTAIAAEVVATPFFDPQGEHLHGRT